MLTSSRMTFLSEKKIKRKEQLDLEALVNGLAYGKFETGSIENAEKRVQVDSGKKTCGQNTYKYAEHSSSFCTFISLSSSLTAKY